MALGLGWVVSDGRALTYASALLSPSTPATRLAARPDRAPTAARPEIRREAALPKSTVALPAPRSRAVDQIRTAALPASAAATPRPAPRLGSLKMPVEGGPPTARTAKPAAPLRAASLTTATAEQAPRLPASATPAMAPAGSEHHATRRLPMRAAPDGTARVLASIDSGTAVRVLRAEGPWRYVASAGGRSEGWVDGTYLAGEASVPLQAPAARAQAPGRKDIAILAPFSPTEDRQAPSARLANSRTRLPPAAISSQ